MLVELLQSGQSVREASNMIFYKPVKQSMIIYNGITPKDYTLFLGYKILLETEIEYYNKLKKKLNKIVPNSVGRPL